MLRAGGTRLARTKMEQKTAPTDVAADRRTHKNETEEAARVISSNVEVEYTGLNALRLLFQFNLSTIPAAGGHPSFQMSPGCH